ncbi:MAG: B3/4 domain-containing protein [Lachnospiraceae bacterium]|nr:B3/4 domain-containing protein [Lachnospiraceae bacterium]
MKKFTIEQSIFEIFPEMEIGILVCNGIENHVTEEEKYKSYLEEAQKEAKKHMENPEFTENPVIRTWRDAFYKFKTKRGARSSIEALLKRVFKGNDIGCINPLVDLYNGISLKYGVPVGGEDIDKFCGDVKLTLAEGGENFITYGSDESDPPLPGEVVYKDEEGAICRCLNWREGIRTMLTEDTTNAFMIIETVDGQSSENLNSALDELKALIEKELGASVTKHIVNSESPEVEIG